MTKRIKRGAFEHSYPLWLRALAFACLLVVVGASSVQAVHIHGQWLPKNAIQAGAAADGWQLPGGEDHCPLCVAMHSALPVQLHVEPVRLMLVDCKAVQDVDREPESVWHFAMFSRPPPVEAFRTVVEDRVLPEAGTRRAIWPDDLLYSVQPMRGNSADGGPVVSLIGLRLLEPQLTGVVHAKVLSSTTSGVDAGLDDRV